MSFELNKVTIPSFSHCSEVTIKDSTIICKNESLDKHNTSTSTECSKPEVVTINSQALVKNEAIVIITDKNSVDYSSNPFNSNIGEH